MVVRGALFALLIAGCTAKPAVAPGEPVPGVIVADAAGQPVDLRATASRAPFTVVEFFSAHCPCQQVHDARLRALYTDFAPRGVGFYAIDAEREASAERAKRESADRHYPYPLLVDPRGASADALGAEFATYTVILDRDGRVRYAGGIDSDRTHLTGDAHAYLRDALDDLLAGREPRVARGKALGCALAR
ncbi:MAG TPA: redoxin family protein [Labilithrix sp.]